MIADLKTNAARDRQMAKDDQCRLWVYITSITKKRSFGQSRIRASQQGLKKLAKKAKVPKSISRNISGYSLRVGAAQDLTNKGISLPQLMVLGGWEKPDTVFRYISKSRIQLA